MKVAGVARWLIIETERNARDRGGTRDSRPPFPQRPATRASSNGQYATTKAADS